MTRLSSYAAQTLQRQIQQGLFLPGELLPSQRELAVTLGISRASLREAISTLEALGLVRSQPGKGVLVTAGLPRSSQPLPDGPAAHSLQQVFQLRAILEPAAAALAASQLDADAEASLHALQQQMEAALHKLDLVAAAEHDLAFHMAIARLSGNVPLAMVIQQFEQPFAHSLRLPFADHSHIWDTADEHRAVLDALCRRDPAAAQAAMFAHLQQAARRIGFVLALPGFPPVPALTEGVAP